MRTEKDIYTEMDPDLLKKFLCTLPKNYVIILKFGATWCRPCQNIKNDCENYFCQLPKQVLCVDLDVDENMEIYSFFKNKRLINGIPALYVYYVRPDKDDNKWYIPDDSLSGSDKNELKLFFDRIKSYSAINKIE